MLQPIFHKGLKMKTILTIALLFTSLNCLAGDKFNEFTEGKYKLYGILETSITNKTVRLVMLPESRSELTVSLDGVHFKKAISLDEKLVEVTGYIEKRVIGKNIVFKRAQIIAIAPQYKKYNKAEKVTE